jgi:hypothetical protein
MGENPWYLMENRTPQSLLGNADSLSENFDARVNISLSFLVGRAADAILKVTEDRRPVCFHT